MGEFIISKTGELSEIPENAIRITEELLKKKVQYEYSITVYGEPLAKEKETIEIESEIIKSEDGFPADSMLKYFFAKHQREYKNIHVRITGTAKIDSSPEDNNPNLCEIIAASFHKDGKQYYWINDTDTTAEIGDVVVVETKYKEQILTVEDVFYEDKVAAEDKYKYVVEIHKKTKRKC